MRKRKYLTVLQYAEAWKKTSRAIYQRISVGKLLVIDEPAGGRGKLVPVCECPDNYFPGRSLCSACKKEVETTQK